MHCVLQVNISLPAAQNALTEAHRACYEGALSAQGKTEKHCTALKQSI